MGAPTLDRQCRSGHLRTDENTKYVTIRGKRTRYCADCRDAARRRNNERVRRKRGRPKRQVANNGHVRDARSVLGDITEPQVLELFREVGLVP